MAETLETVRFAEEAGASVFVAHFGAGDRAREIVETVLDETRDLGIVLTTETMGGDHTRYFGTVDRVGSERFGLTVDIGHPRDADGVNPFVKPERAREALVACGARVRHLHLHETFDLEEKRDHHPPLHPGGIIEWGSVFGALSDIEYQGELLFEDGRGEDPAAWSRATGDFPEAFVERYGG
jgi:sugar phosphate isomerase/epimerase